MAMTYLTKLKPEPMGAHSLSTAYGVNSLVMSEDGAAAYISVKDVPAGTPLTNTEYWKIHTDLTAVKQSAEAAAQRANAARDEMLEIARNLTDMVEKSGNTVQAELVGGLPFDRVATALSPIQSGSGDPSPSNIRPISGWTGAELTRCGKNLLNPNNMINAKQLTKPGEAPAIKNGYGWKRASGNTEPVIGQTNNLTVMKVNTTYTVSFVSWVIEVGSTISLSIDCYPDTLPETSINITSTPTKYSWTFSTTDEAIESAKIRFFNTNNYDVNICVVDVQLEKGSTATEYEPYHGNTYTADFGQTVYGGTLDWQTGVLTVEWELISSYSGEALPGIWISDRDVYSAGATPTTGAQIAYKLATPTTIQLTPQEIKQLQGMNTLYGDGSISIIGRVDKALALEARIAAVTPDDNAVDGKPWTSKKTVDILCMPIEATGNPVQCHPVEHYPLGVVSRIDATQSGTGDASPDNIRPIVGWDSVSLNRCGKNLVKHRYAPGYTETKNGLTFTVNNDYSITANGTATEETYFNFIRIESEKLITNKPINAVGKTVLCNGFIIRDICIQPHLGTHSTLLYIVIVKDAVIDTTYYPMILYNSADTAYEPYTGDTYTAELPETIYGGELDWNTGVLTVTHGQIASYASETLPGEWISDRDIYAPGATPTTGAQVAYKLAKPYTIQLTPQQIAALSGVNTLYTDAGTLTVTGREDPQHTITELKNAIISLGGNI